MPLLRLSGAARPTVFGIGLVLASLLAAVLGAVLPTRAASAETTALARSVRVTFTGAGIWGGTLRSTYALSTKPVPAQFYARKEWSKTGGGSALVTAVVERRAAGGTWRATSQRVSTRSTTFRAHLPAYTSSATEKDATVQYRLHVPTGGVIGKGAVSGAITVQYRNPARFTGLTRTLYVAVHPYCPSAVVRILHLTGDAAGDYTTGQYALRIDSAVTGYTAIDRRAVVLHECGHYLQWRNYGATGAGWSRMTRDAEAVFGTNSNDPVEHMADCIAQAANPGGYMGYGGRCTAGQLAASKRMLAGYRVR